MKKRLLIIFAILLIGVSAKVQAYDFSAESNGQTFYFKITSDTAPYEVEVTYQLNTHPYNLLDLVGDITIPNTVEHNGNTYSVTSIGEKAFYNCDSIRSVVIPNSVTSIGSWGFYDCHGLTSITIPISVTSIGKYAFSGCYELSSIAIPNSVTSIGDGAFRFCIELTSINIPNSLTTIEYQTFLNCRSLTSITLPNSLITIGEKAFEGCIGLTSLIVPNSVTTIKTLAFNKCTGLSSITSNALIPPSIQDSSFLLVSRTIPVYVPCASIAAYQAADYWSEFTNITCESDLNDILITETQTKLYPNPTTGSAILEVEGLTKSAEVFVYDITGRKVKTYNLQPNQTQLSIDLTSFAKGIYQVKVLNQTKKLIIN